MTRFIILCTKFLVTIILTLLITSCNFNFNGISGNGNVTTEKRTINEPFTKIQAKRGVEVILQQNDEVDVEVEADENLIPHIKTTVENGTLVITTDENIGNYEALTIKVKLPTLEGIEASSGATVTNNNVLLGKQLAVSTSSGSEVEINAEYDTFTTDASSGSNQTLSGKALKFTATTSSGSEIDAEALMANDVVANASSGSSMQVKPLVSLKAGASSGASIKNYGTAKSITEDETSGGSISKL